MEDTIRKDIKIGLIIQGPMISTGLTGNSVRNTEKKLQPGNYVEYDCHDNIRLIVKNYEAFFSGICLATWSGALVGDFIGLDVLEFNDSTPDVGNNPKQVYTSINNKNKYRQYFLCYQGAKHLKEKYRPDYIIKMRTDQHINLELICRYIVDIASKENNSQQQVLIPYINRNLLYIGDFYYAGKTDIMLSFFYSFISYDYYEFYLDLKLEVSLKFARNVFFDEVGAPSYAYFPRTCATFTPRKTAKILFYLCKYVYRPLPHELYKTIIWRGEGFREKVNKELTQGVLFSEDFGHFNAGVPHTAEVKYSPCSIKNLLTAYDYIRWLKFEILLR